MIAKGSISSPAAANLLKGGGGAHQFAEAEFIRRFPCVLKDEIRFVYRRTI